MIEYLRENEKVCKTVFACSYRAQVESFKQKKPKISWHCLFKGVLKWNQIRRKGSEPRKGAGSVKWKTVLLQKSTCSTHVSLRDIVTKRSYMALQHLPPYLGTRILVAASSSLRGWPDSSSKRLQAKSNGFLNQI